MVTDSTEQKRTEHHFGDRTPPLAALAERILDHWDFPSDASEMGERMRAHDWSMTPLGPPETWPRSLQTLVTMILESRLPAILAWGPDLICIYNDAYRPLLGSKEGLGHPFRATWSEALEIIDPQIERVLAGESVYLENAPFTLLRRGRGGGLLRLQLQPIAR